MRGGSIVEETERARGVTLGTTLKGRYKLRRLLNFSDLSSVWEGADNANRQQVAIKVTDLTDPVRAHIAAREATLLQHLTSWQCQQHARSTNAPAGLSACGTTRTLGHHEQHHHHHHQQQQQHHHRHHRRHHYQQQQQALHPPNPPLSATTSPLSATTSPLSATTSPLSATTSPLSATTSPLSATTSPLSATTSPQQPPASEWHNPQQQHFHREPHAAPSHAHALQAPDTTHHPGACHIVRTLDHFIHDAHAGVHTSARTPKHSNTPEPSPSQTAACVPSSSSSSSSSSAAAADLPSQHSRPLSCLVLERLGPSLQSVLQRGWDGTAGGPQAGKPRRQKHSPSHPASSPQQPSDAREHAHEHGPAPGGGCSSTSSHPSSGCTPQQHSSDSQQLRAAASRPRHPGFSVEGQLGRPNAAATAHAHGGVGAVACPSPQQHALSQAEARALAQQTLLALDYLHRCCGIMHRDLKPGNLVCAGQMPADVRAGHTPKLAAGQSQAGPHAQPLPSSPLPPDHHHHHHQQQQQQQQQQQRQLHWKLIDFGNAVVHGSSAAAAAVQAGPHAQPLPSAGDASPNHSHALAATESSAACGGKVSSSSPAAPAAAAAAPVTVFQSLAYAPPEELLGIVSSTSVASQPVQHGWQGRPSKARRQAKDTIMQTERGSPCACAQQGEGQRECALLAGGCWGTPPSWAHPSNDMWSLGCVLYEASTGCKLVDVVRARQAIQAGTQAAAAEKARLEQPTGLQGLIQASWQSLTGGRKSQSDSPSVSSTTPILQQQQQQQQSWWSRKPGSTGGKGGLEDDEVALWLMSRVSGGFTPSLLVRSSLAPSEDYFYAHGGMLMDSLPGVVHLTSCQLRLTPPPPHHSHHHRHTILTTTATPFSPPPPQPFSHPGSHPAASASAASSPRMPWSAHASSAPAAAAVSHRRAPCPHGLVDSLPVCVVAWPLRERLRIEACGMDDEEADALAAFLTPLLQLDPDLRPSAAEQLQHPWLKGTSLQKH